MPCAHVNTSTKALGTVGRRREAWPNGQAFNPVSDENRIPVENNPVSVEVNGWGNPAEPPLAVAQLFVIEGARGPIGGRRGHRFRFHSTHEDWEISLLGVGEDAHLMTPDPQGLPIEVRRYERNPNRPIRPETRFAESGDHLWRRRG
jgi:hypothetical protein